ncbi:MAG: hypothetical protein K2X03_31120 [Bryobacteraceae bacterium]|nr:hypothetical protein [Bryobacteraceae bacterium]
MNRNLAFTLFFGALLLPAQPRVDLGPVSEAEASEKMMGKLLKTGIHRAMAPAAIRQGAWEAGAEGERVYRLLIQSPAAAGLRLHFTGFAVGEGEVTLRQPGQPAADYARYRGQGPFDDGDFWSHTIDGAELLLEYRPAPGEAVQAPAFQVSEVSHRFAESAGKIGFGFGDPGKCHLDINCHSEWLDSGRSVAMIYFETDQGQASCTGALVRTKSGSGIPYFLTADHCLSNDATARTVEAIWNFQTAKCNDKQADLARIERSSPTGARYVTSRGIAGGDFSLVILNSIPAGARFANYDPTDPAVGNPLVGIHHPLATFKRISFGNLFVDYWAFDKTFPTRLFHQVRWTGGATHHGSSGSPLFSRPNTITGMLSYGPEFAKVSICEQEPRVDGYAKLSEGWPFFSPYLDDPTPNQLTVTPANTSYTLVNPNVATLSEGRTLVVNSTAVDGATVSIVPSDPWIVVSRTLGNVRAGSPMAIPFWVRPSLINRTGQYAGRITVTSGKTVQVIPVTANVRIVPSQVAVQSTPNPVPPSAADANGCRYFFNVSAQESAGIDTQLTAFQINGVDYTPEIAAWFGGVALPRNGRLEARVRVCSPGTPAWHTFTLAGTDTLTGRTWTQSTTVEFLP